MTPLSQPLPASFGAHMPHATSCVRAGIFKCKAGGLQAVELNAAFGLAKENKTGAGCYKLKGANCTSNSNCSLCATPKGKEICFAAPVAKMLPPCESPAAAPGCCRCCRCSWRRSASGHSRERTRTSTQK